MSNARVLARAASWGFLISLVGCFQISNGENSPSTNDVVKLSSASREFDAGLVFLDRSNYLCVPLSRFQISGDQNPTVVSTSCNCVNASVVSYQLDTTAVGRAVLLEFEPTFELASLENPSSLSVTVKLALSTGEARVLTVNFLHTRLMGN